MKTALRAAGLASPNLSMTVAAFAGMDDINGIEGPDRRSHQLLVQSVAPQTCERKEVACKHGVEVKVPKAGGLRFQEQQEVNGNVVPAHYHHVKHIDGLIVNCHYYGITSFDFGRAITATVEIVDKIMGDRKFTFFNFRKVTTSEPQLDMKIMPDTEGIPLAGTNHSVHFLPRP